MSLWTKQIGTIEWTDIENFLGLRLTEGTRLDYKRDFPDTLHRHISAMANTQGGLLLLGVDQDSLGAPVTPPYGVELRGIDARAEQKALDAIYPGLLPEVQLVENPATPGRGVAVVRVEESPQAPHAIQNTTRVYVRTGQHSNPEELAQLDWVERLLKRRADREAERRHCKRKPRNASSEAHPCQLGQAWWFHLASRPDHC